MFRGSGSLQGFRAELGPKRFEALRYDAGNACAEFFRRVQGVAEAFKAFGHWGCPKRFEALRYDDGNGSAEKTQRSDAP
jgi:hypothetical protein